MASLYLELKSRSECETKLCVTAQHREMLDQVLTAFGITPDFDLNIMRERQTLTDIVCNSLQGMEGVLDEYRPDLLLVHGDTGTAFAASLAAFHKQIPVGHVEAGLRTWDKLAPYPEEVYRQVIDDIADLYFAPTEHSRENLLREGKDPSKIIVTGNTEIDALRYTVREDYSHAVLESVSGLTPVFMECHRRENLGEPMRSVFRAVKRFVGEFEDVAVIFPVHLNPAVREAADLELGGVERVTLIDPLEVTDCHNFMNKCYFILTDSGGLQEGAAGLNKPVLVARDVTERPEGITAGTLKLVGTNEQTVYENLRELFTNRELYANMSNALNPFGDGFASKRIADAILKDN